MSPNSKLAHWVVWGGLAVVILAIVFAFVREQSGEPQTPLAKPELPVLSQLSDFRLTNQLANPVGLGNFKGKVWFADIIFTRCAGPCPAMTRRMAELKEHFVGEPDVVFATLTTDPDYDTPEIMHRFAKRFGAFHEEDRRQEDHRWQFLTGSKQEIVRLAVDGMKLVAREKSPGEQASPDDLFIHATLFVVIDRQGRLRGVLESMEDGWKEKAIALATKLLNE